MTFWKTLCTACGAAGAACICIATGGLAAPAIVGLSAAAGFGGYLVGDKADKEASEREDKLMQDQRYKDAKQEEDKQAQQNNQSQSLITEIAGKINGQIPRQPHETDEYLKQQLALAQNQLKVGEGRLERLKKDVDKLRKELGGNTSLLH